MWSRPSGSTFIKSEINYYILLKDGRVFFTKQRFRATAIQSKEEIQAYFSKIEKAIIIIESVDYYRNGTYTNAERTFSFLSGIVPKWNTFCHGNILYRNNWALYLNSQVDTDYFVDQVIVKLELTDPNGVKYLLESFNTDQPLRIPQPKEINIPTCISGIMHALKHFENYSQYDSFHHFEEAEKEFIEELERTKYLWLRAKDVNTKKARLLLSKEIQKLTTLIDN